MAELAIATIESVELFGLPAPFTFNIPDVFIGPAFEQPRIDIDLFDFNNEDTETLKEFSLGPLDFEVALPGQFSVISTDQTASSTGGITASNVSDPFFTSTISLQDLLGLVPSPGFALIQEVLQGSYTIEDRDLELSWTLLDLDIQVELSLIREVVFTPTATNLTLTETSTGLSQTGEFGDILTVAAPDEVGNADFRLDANVSGQIQERWGVVAEIVIPFTLLEFGVRDLDSGAEDTIGPLLSEEFRLQITDPLFIIEPDAVDIEFDAQSLEFSVAVTEEADGSGGGTGGGTGGGGTGGGSTAPVLPVVSLQASAEVVEGQTFQLAVTLNEAADGPVTVTYIIQQGTAEAGDIRHDVRQVTIAAGATQALIAIDTLQDDDFDQESLSLTVTGADGAIIGNERQATLSIADNDIPDTRPTLLATINARADEGDDLEFEVRLDGATDRDATIEYRIISVSAEREDLGSFGGVATVAAGSDSVTISVPTELDGDGDDEEVRFEITALNGIRFSSDTIATGIITDTFTAPAEPPVFAGLADQSVSEGGVLSFDLVLDQPAANDLIVSYEINNLTAENTDYFPIGGFETLIRRGDSSGVIEVQTLADSGFLDETFEVVITDVFGGDIPQDNRAIGTIVDPDEPTLPLVTITGNQVTENGEAVFTFDLGNNPRNDRVTINYRIEGGTATEGVDFVEVNGSRSISTRDDQNNLTVRVQTLGDNLVENDETIRLVVESVSGGLVNSDVIEATIIDDDDPGTRNEIYIFPERVFSSVEEGDKLKFFVGGDTNQYSSSYTMQLVLRELDLADVEQATLKYIDRDGFRQEEIFREVDGFWTNVTTGARTREVAFTFNANFAFISESSSFSALDRHSIEIEFADDSEFTGNREFGVETFVFGLDVSTAPPDFYQTVTITDNELPPPDVTIAASTVEEGGTATITAQLDGAYHENIVLDYRITDSAGAVVRSGSLAIASGDTQGAVQFAIADNGQIDGDRRLTFEVLSVSQGQAEILDTEIPLLVLDDERLPFTEGNDTVAIPEGEGGFAAYALAGDDTVDGSSSGDAIYGGFGNDALRGLGGDDAIYGNRGVDTLVGGIGNDRLFGGSNVDTAIVNGNRSAYTVTQSSMGVFEVAGSDGTDVLTDIEFVQFDDETLRLRPGSGVAVNFETADPSVYQEALNAILDFDGNALGGNGSWLRIGSADVNGDGDLDQLLVNDAIGRFATIGTAPDGLIYFNDNGWAGETRVAGIYIDPLVEAGVVERFSANDSQRRFQNDLQIENINRVLGADDYDGDGLQDVYFALTDGTAYLRAVMEADGNIRYANYQSEEQVIEFLNANGFGDETYGDWFTQPSSQANQAGPGVQAAINPLYSLEPAFAPTIHYIEQAYG